jgi:hypothetical protein
MTSHCSLGSIYRSARIVADQTVCRDSGIGRFSVPIPRWSFSNKIKTSCCEPPAPEPIMAYGPVTSDSSCGTNQRQNMTLPAAV